jgi:hypothetical protein
LTNSDSFPASGRDGYRVDALLFFMVLMTGSVAIGVFTVVIYYAVRYRRRSSTWKERGLSNRWAGVVLDDNAFDFPPHVCLGCAEICMTMAQPASHCIDVMLSTKGWMWKVQHPQGTANQ